MSKSSIIVAGDCCLRDRTAALNAEQLFSLFEEVKPIIQSVDAALVNLETAVTESKLSPIRKSGPYIKTDNRILEVISKIGFTGVTLANNHFADYGADGMAESLQLLERYGLWYVGAGMNADDAAQTKYLQVGEKQVAIINACEHEFTIASNNQAGCNALNLIRQYKAIQNVKQKADYILLIIHGGVEHYQLPTLRMQETYRFFIDAGADAIINHHQHCFSGYERYQGKPIIYGLGNFFFDWQGQDANWNKGYMVKLSFGEKIEFELIPYIQNADIIGIKLMDEADKKLFDADMAKLNKIIVHSDQLQSNFTSWVEKNKEEYLRYVQPNMGKNIKRLERWHLIQDRQRENWCPEYLTESRRLLLKSLFQNESHQDVMNIILR